MALVDGRSEEAREEGALPDKSLKLIWIGAVAPASCWRSFDRPLSWPDVISAMDELFGEPAAIDLDLDLDADVDVDLDFDGDAPDTAPPMLSDPQAPAGRALIVSSDRDQRLYLRARLALADLTQVDEAHTGAEALALARAATYCVALVDFDLPDVDGWTLLKALKTAQPGPLQVIATKARPSLVERLRARWSGGCVLLSDPPQPASLRSALQKVARQRGRTPARR